MAKWVVVVVILVVSLVWARYERNHIQLSAEWGGQLALLRVAYAAEARLRTAPPDVYLPAEQTYRLAEQSFQKTNNRNPRFLAQYYRHRIRLCTTALQDSRNDALNHADPTEHNQQVDNCMYNVLMPQY